MQIPHLPEGLTFDDVLLVPQKSVVVPSQISVKNTADKNVRAQHAAHPERGDGHCYRGTHGDCACAGSGVGIIHKNMSIEDQASNVDKGQRSEHGVITDPFGLSLII